MARSKETYRSAKPSKHAKRGKLRRHMARDKQAHELSQKLGSQRAVTAERQEKQAKKRLSLAARVKAKGRSSLMSLNKARDIVQGEA